MADRPAAPTGFTPAHKVVIDCSIFLTGQVLVDDRTALVWDLLRDALPHAHAMGLPAMDRLTLAATSALHGHTIGGLIWAEAALHLNAAVANFAWDRLSRSATEFTAFTQQELAP